MLDELNKALDALTLADSDAPAEELAALYAEAIDEGKPLDVYGPKLLSVLESLGMTPRSRAVLLKGELPDVQAPDPLDELRKRRAARVGNA